jgi:hypothetical protein
MRYRISFFFVLIITFQFGSAQVIENFFDGDFTNNPEWSGDTDLFLVIANQLNAQSPTSGNYYLSTPSNLALNTQWDFYFNMKFGTSGVNYVDVYLIADIPNLINPNDGYFVRIGGSSDEVSLYKIVGGVETILIDGPDGVINSSSNNPFDVRVTRDAGNNWILFYDDGATNNMVSIGTVVDHTITSSSFFGIAITQSGAASAVNGHFFDNFNVGVLGGADVFAPTIDSLVVVNSTLLDVYFNEVVDATTSQNLAHYFVNEGVGNPSAAVRSTSDSAIVQLTFLTEFTNGQYYNLTINNVTDTLANAITSLIEPFNYLHLIAPTYGAILITEIFADPVPQVDLPTKEFVELYNNTNTLFELNNWKFVNSTTVKTLPNFYLQANSYVILCDIQDTALYSPYGDVISVPSFSALVNSGDSLTLMDNNNTILDVVHYDFSWYQDAEKDDGGWSLERVNPTHPCSNPANWTASINATGGTPGIQNSVFDTLPDIVAPLISSVHPIDTNQLAISFNETMDSTNLANAVFTLSGAVSVSSFLVSGDLKGGVLTTSTLDSSIVYTLKISGASDCSGNLVYPDTINFGIGVHPSKYEITINELFVDPSPSNGLPTEDYLELFNNTTKIIDLTSCWIADLTSMAQLTAAKILPGEQLIICDNNFENQFSPFGKVIGLTSMPSLNNSEDQISLYTADTSLIHSVHYFDSWYRDDNKKDGGWSLEMIDPNNPCGEADNWMASSQWLGGTPGAENTAFGTNKDIVWPALTAANAISDSSLLISFNETLDSDGIISANYTIDHGILVSSIQLIDNKNVLLNLSTKLVFQVNYSITVTAIYDCLGNLIGSDNTATFALPEQGAAKDLIINEILFNPFTGSNDFVEIYNNSSKFINIQGWSLGNLENDSIDNYKNLTDQPKLISPGEFVLLTKNTEGVVNEYLNAVETSFLKMESLPTYSNDKGDVYLINNLNSVVDEFHYKKELHFELLDNKEGVSLERIDYDRPSSDPANWHSAAEAIGFATPGFENSQHLQGMKDEGGIVVWPKTFSPDNDGIDDVVSISYYFSTEGNVANVIIYDAKGRLVKRLIQNELLGREGVFSWDGINDANEIGLIGIYIIFVEVFNVNGRIKLFKKTVVLAGKFN